MKTTETARDREDRVLGELLRDTMEGRLRWGFQPPSTIQTNRGKIHFVLRARTRRETIYKLTARRDGGKAVSLSIERAEAEADPLTRIYRFATAGPRPSEETR